VVRHLCDRVAVLHRGTVVESGETQQIYTAPSADYTRRLIDSVPSIQRALAGVDARHLAQATVPPQPEGDRA
jgi:ABC-type oligopeptide transport system ATPase subunit